MQIEALKLYCDVVRLRSFSGGARENHVTQSTASQAIHQIEEGLGASLIDRSHRPWTPTPAGKIFFEGCRELVERFQELESRVKKYHLDAASTIRVACIYSVGLTHMQRYRERFGVLHPEAQVEVDYLHPEQVLQAVLDDQADLGIVSFPPARRELTVIPWRSEEMVVACLPAHRLSRRRSIAPRDLKGEKFVAFDRGMTIRREIDRFLKENGVAVEPVLDFDNIEEIKGAVEVGSGIAILPRPTLDREVAARTLVAVPFSSRHLVRPLGIVHRRGRRFPANVTAFIEILKTGEPRREAA